MRILFLGLNYAPDSIGVAKYSTEMCEALAAAGHDVTAVVGKPYYPEWSIPEEHRGGWRQTRERGVRVVRCPLYVPANPSAARRLIHHSSFLFSSTFPTFLAAIRRPDVVLTVAPSLLAAPLAWIAARLCGARALLHVQDFELGAAMATGLLGARSPLARAASWLERAIIRRFDLVSSIGPEMCARLAAIGVPKTSIVEFRNWSDVRQVRPLNRPSRFRTSWGIGAPHVALYSGNIANKQGLDVVLDAARELRHRDDLLFAICGQGANRRALEASAQDLSNVRFFDLQPPESLCELLNLATIHLLPQRAEAAGHVLPSKLTNMLASGRPAVVTADAGTGLAAEVEGCGLVTPPGDAHAFARAIERLIDDSTLSAALGRAARARAETVWDARVILSRFESTLVALAEGRPPLSDRPERLAP